MSPAMLARGRDVHKESVAIDVFVDAVSIADRPPCVEDRAIPGRWEGDLWSGAQNTHIATLVERTSRYVHFVRVTSKETTAAVTALIREVQHLPVGFMASLAWDRGLEMAQNHRFSLATEVAVYFWDPPSPWQRGTNENSNGLLRQNFPDGTDLSVYSQRDRRGARTPASARARWRKRRCPRPAERGAGAPWIIHARVRPWCFDDRQTRSRRTPCRPPAGRAPDRQVHWHVRRPHTVVGPHCSGRARTIAPVSERVRGFVHPLFEISDAAVDVREALVDARSSGDWPARAAADESEIAKPQRDHESGTDDQEPRD